MLCCETHCGAILTSLKSFVMRSNSSIFFYKFSSCSSHATLPLFKSKNAQKRERDKNYLYHGTDHCCVQFRNNRHGTFCVVELLTKWRNLPTASGYESYPSKDEHDQ